MDSESNNLQNLSLIQDTYNSNNENIRQRFRVALRYSFFLFLLLIVGQLILFVTLVIYYKEWYQAPFLILKILATVLTFMLTFIFTFYISKNYCFNRDNIFENLIDAQMEKRYQDTLRESLKNLLINNHRIISINKIESNEPDITVDSECSICFEKIIKNDENIIIELSCCKKKFCLDCLMDWINKDIVKNNNCPLCRNQII